LCFAGTGSAQACAEPHPAQPVVDEQPLHALVLMLCTLPLSPRLKAVKLDISRTTRPVEQFGQVTPESRSSMLRRKANGSPHSSQ
jgi:hypothetical protein